MTGLVLSFLLWAVPVLLAITLHEAAHGYAAQRLGDSTAYLAGRISINPMRHIDPVGTVLVPALIVLAGQLSGLNFPPFGWAKPVPVNFSQLHNPKRDMIWVAAAGPLANLVQAFGWGGLLSLQNQLGGYGGEYFHSMAQAGIVANLALMLLNLLPIPPLDGGRIVVGLLPFPFAWRFAQLERYGFFILIALLWLGVLDRILWPLIPHLAAWVMALTGG